jgi:flagellar M-ring protein FliF
VIAQLNAALRRAMAAFGRFTPGQKAATICTIIGLAVGGFLFAQWAMRPNLAPLYSNLSGADASAIVDKLNASGTTHKLADGGQTILVPQDQVYELRLTMSGAGLPAGKDTGYALLDKQGVTASEFMQHVGYQRALEGELANTIGAIKGVQSATVHLAVPQKDVFTDDATKPTASVLVASAPDLQLSGSQVQAIVHLVSSSVVGLDANQVTVADATGRVLSIGGGSDVGSDSGAGPPGQQTQAFEGRMNSALQRMLDQVLGAGHSAVQVSADLNYDQTDTKSQTYVGGGANTPALSQSTHSETYTGTGSPNAAGVLGPDNIQVPTSAISGNAGAGNGTYSQKTDTRDNAVGVVTETRKAAPGAVRRLSVAVLLDSKIAGVDQVKVQKLISSAAGLDVKRGDTVAVTALPFDDTAAKAARDALALSKKTEGRASLLDLAKKAAAVLLGLVLLFGAWRSSRKRRRGMDLTDAERAALDDMQTALDGQRARALGDGGAGSRALGAGGPLNADDRAQVERAERQGDLMTLVERQPDEVAQLLRGWLADKKG